MSEIVNDECVFGEYKGEWISVWCVTKWVFDEWVNKCVMSVWWVCYEWVSECVMNKRMNVWWVSEWVCDLSVNKCVMSDWVCDQWENESNECVSVWSMREWEKWVCDEWVNECVWLYVSGIQNCWILPISVICKQWTLQGVKTGRIGGEGSRENLTIIFQNV